jgi:large subunit ribosomal protein L29
MKAAKIRELDPKEIENQLAETNEQLFRLRFQMKMGQTDPVKKYRILRKDRARLLTVLNEQARAQAKKAAK